MSDDPLVNMHERMVKCRWLAHQILDVQATQALLQMADEIERDIKRLEAERLVRADPAKGTSGADQKMPPITIRPE
jgi:hypothetical protein